MSSDLFGPAAPSIQLTPAEKTLFGKLFRQADPNFSQFVSGDAASQLFIKSGLPPVLLGQIWQMADPQNTGQLDQHGFSIALRIIGHVQSGQRLAAHLAKVAGPLPSFDNTPSSPSQQPLQPQSSSSSSTQIPPIGPADRANYAQLFARNAPSGLLDGVDAREILFKSGLPNDTLIQIWNLADTQNRGQLDLAEFVLAMHLIKSVLNKSLRQLPSTLPPGLLESFKQQPASRSASGVSVASASGSRAPSVLSNNGTGQRLSQFASLNSPAARASPVAHQYTGPLQHPHLKHSQQVPQQQQQQQQEQPEWFISQQDRAKFDNIFASLDKAQTGVIGADEVVPFLTTSNLPEDTLAQVWDLADIRNTGRFGRNEFAIAMYLVQQRLAGKALPTTLPAALYPGNTGNIQPQQQQQQQQPQQQSQSQPAAPVGNSSLNDLLSLGDSLSSPPPPQQAKVTENTTGSQAGLGISNVRAPFVPTSSFGQSQLNTSTPPPGPSSAQPTTDSDPDFVNKLSTISTDNANLTNQVNSMNAQTSQTRQKRERAEQELNRVLASKSDLESRLASLRAEYDAELKKVNQAEQLLHQSQKDTDKLSAEFSVLEASYHSVQSQYQEISAQLAHDQQENATFKDKIRSISEETTALKSTLEKVQKEAKQQKNLLAVTKKQYNYAESERDKLQSQIQQASAPAAASSSASTSTPVEQTRELAPSATGSGFGGNTNPFYHSFGQQSQSQPPQPLSFADTTPTFSAGFDDQFHQLDVASPSTADPARSSTHNTVDTPNSSPPNSEYQYNPGHAALAQFTLPLARPESATSSVQNNPPMSVRDDIDTSRPDTPEFPVTSEPVSGIVPPEDMVIRPFGGGNFDAPPAATGYSAPALPPLDQHQLGQNVTSGSHHHHQHPFEASQASLQRPFAVGESAFSPSTESVHTTTKVATTAVPAAAAAAATAAVPATTQNTGSTIEAPSERGDVGGQDQDQDQDPNSMFEATFKSLSANPTGASTSSSGWPAAPVPSASAVPTSKTTEFPPIKELDYEESDSDEEATPQTSSPVQAGPATTAGSSSFAAASTAVPPPVPAKDHTNAPPPTTGDAFDAAFDGLTVADEEKDDSTAGGVEVPESSAFSASISAPFNFGAPAPVAATGPQHQQQSGFDVLPSDGTAAPATSGAAGVSNEEWDSIFAGFGGPSATNASASAGASEVDKAFAPSSGSTAPVSAPVPTPTPKSAAVQELVGMGFSQEQATKALQKNGFDLASASNYLLDH